MESNVLDLLLRHVGVFVALVIVAKLAWNLWINYVNMAYLRSIDWIMLEIIPPKEVFKSPAAMELVLNFLYGGDATNKYLRYWKGEMSQTYSLEIASIEGKIHFYIRFHKKFRKGFEAQLYAQYPQAEIREVPDYTKSVPDFVPGGPISMFGITMGLAKDDPYPIKSYVDFGLDKAIGSLEEAERIDPITPILETMGSIGIGEQLWMQIILQKESKRHTVGDEGGKSAKDKAREVLKKKKEELNMVDPETKKVLSTERATKGHQYVVESIERHMNKPGFDAGMRIIYVARKENFNGNTIGAFTAMFRQFTSEDLNTLKITGITKPPDEPWKDIGGFKLNKKKKHMLADYKDREYFYSPFRFDKISRYFTTPEERSEKPMLLSTEEIATLWHLPGRVVETPTVGRIESKKGEPPANLPI